MLDMYGVMSKNTRVYTKYMPDFLKIPLRFLRKKSLIIDRGGVLFESELLGNKALREITWQNNTNNAFLCMALGICGFS
jgi:hypothetical protein